MLDRHADKEAIRLLKKVDKLRKDLRTLEPQLRITAREYGGRRGYYTCFSEWNMRNTIEIEKGKV